MTFHTLTKAHGTPIDILVEWAHNHVMMYHGDKEMPLILIDHTLEIEAETIDKVILVDLHKFDLHLTLVLEEANRMMKRNGRLYISFDENRPMKRLFGFSKLKAHARSLDHIMDMLNKQGMLVEKNFILGDQQIVLEVVKLESDILKKKIVI